MDRNDIRRGHANVMAAHAGQGVAGAGRIQQNLRTRESRRWNAKALDIPTMQHANACRGRTAMRHRVGALTSLAIAAALLSGCQTDGAPSNPLSELAAFNDKKAEPAKPPEPPMTRSRAAQDCWMKTEKGRRDGDLDKRADIVNKCIDEKMKTVQAAPKS